MSWIRDYPDWLRQGDWDGPLLYTNHFSNQVGGFNTGMMDVRSFANLAMQVKTTQGHWSMTMHWYLDSGGATQLGQRTIIFDSGVVVAGSFRVSNLGSFCRIFFSGDGINQYGAQVDIAPTNRSSPLEITPSSPILVQVENQAVVGNQVVDCFPISYYAGPATWHSFCNQQHEIGFFTPDSVGVYHEFSNFVVAGNQQGQGSVVLPPGAWKAQYLNDTVTPTSFWLYVNASMTGSL